MTAGGVATSRNFSRFIISHKNSQKIYIRKKKYQSCCFLFFKQQSRGNVVHDLVVFGYYCSRPSSSFVIATIRCGCYLDSDESIFIGKRLKRSLVALATGWVCWSGVYHHKEPEGFFCVKISRKEQCSSVTHRSRRGGTTAPLSPPHHIDLLCRVKKCKLGAWINRFHITKNFKTLADKNCERASGVDRGR